MNIENLKQIVGRVKHYPALAHRGIAVINKGDQQYQLDVPIPLTADHATFIGNLLTHMSYSPVELINSVFDQRIPSEPFSHHSLLIASMMLRHIEMRGISLGRQAKNNDMVVNDCGETVGYLLSIVDTGVEIGVISLASTTERSS